MATKRLYHSSDSLSPISGWTAGGAGGANPWAAIAPYVYSSQFVCGITSGPKPDTADDRASVIRTDAGSCTTNGDYGTLHKDFDISGYATDIDAGNVDYDFGSYLWVQAWTLGEESAWIAIEFYDGSDVIIGSRISSTAVIETDCDGEYRNLSGTVPTNTRKIRAILLFNSTNTSSHYHRNWYAGIFLDISGTNVTATESIKVTQAGLESLVTEDPDTPILVTQAGLEALIALPDYQFKALHVFTSEETITGWTRVNADSFDWGVATSADGVGGLVTPYSGNYLITAAASGNNQDSEIYKDFDVSGMADAIDFGLIRLYFGAYISVYDLNNDPGRISVEFYDGVDVIIGSRVSSEWYGANSNWSLKKIATAVPAGTRKVRLLYESDYRSGTYSNSYFSTGVAYLEGFGVQNDAFQRIAAVNTSVLTDNPPKNVRVAALSVAVLTHEVPESGKKPLIISVIT